MKDAKRTKTVFRFWWAWNDEKEERWMEERSREGWHMKSFRPFFCTLEEGSPAETAYRLDYQSGASLPPKNREEYLALFGDAGWELVGDYAGWYCFRHPGGDGPAPEIHTDTESRIAKYKRLTGVLAFFLVFILLTSIGRGFQGVSSARTPLLADIYWTAQFFQFAIALLLGYALIRLCMRMKQLKEKEGRRPGREGS